MNRIVTTALRALKEPLHDIAAIRTAAPGTGLKPLLLILGLAAVDRFDNAAFGILGPELRRAFDLSNSEFLTIASLTSVLPILLVVYVGYLSDRTNRVRLMRIGGFIGAVTALLTGFAPVLAVLLAVRLASGVGQTVYGPTQPSLLSDYYPPVVLATVFGVYQFAQNAIGLIAGPTTGLLTQLFGWRATFVVLSVPIFALVLYTARLHEPPRGESTATPHEVEHQHPRFFESFRTLRRIKSVRRIWLAAMFFGGGFVGFTSLHPLFFEDVYGVGPTGRGLIAAAFGAAGLLGVTQGGHLAQARVRRGDLRGLAVSFGLCIGLFGVGIVLLAVSPTLWLSVLALTVASFGASAFSPAYQTIVAFATPARLRGQAFAWIPMFAALGALLISPTIGSITDAIGDRPGMALLGMLIATCGALATTVRADVQRDVDAATQVADAEGDEPTGLLVCNGVELAYGQVQILFGVDLVVQQGEIIAILGTNGAGKSTLVKAISGLVEFQRGTIVFDGTDITYADAAAVTEMGISHIPGGRGIFAGLTVRENLRAAGWQLRGRPAEREAATEQVFAYFPRLRERLDVVAGSLSGGEQQMLSLGMAFLRIPKLLIIDELSLGLAPIVVDQLLDIVREIHARGTTVILVEQSVHTALRVANRAIFMEKGQVRFVGPTADLLKRPDVLRSVYLEGSATALNGAGTTRNRPANGKAAVGERASQEGPVVLETVGLTKRYAGICANDNVSLQVHHGEIVGLIGPNGAGKTTLFDVISGLADHDSGRILLSGHDISRLAAHRRSSRGLARSFQDSLLWPSLTVREALAVAFEHEIGERSAVAAALRITAVTHAEAEVERRLQELIELLGLGAFRDKFVGELSTGSRRIVEIAATMAQQPSLLLLDEPSSGIAQRETEELLPFLRAVQQRLGCAMLVIEHDMNLITGLADRIYALDQGGIIAVGAPDEILREPRVVESYLGSAAMKPPRRQRTVKTRS